jgi:hypothetical protein
VHVRLTPAGYQAFEQHASTEEHAERELLAVLTQEEKQTLADLLRKLVVAVESGPDVTPACTSRTRSRDGSGSQ